MRNRKNTADATQGRLVFPRVPLAPIETPPKEYDLSIMIREIDSLSKQIGPIGPKVGQQRKLSQRAQLQFERLMAYTDLLGKMRLTDDEVKYLHEPLVRLYREARNTQVRYQIGKAKCAIFPGSK